jgi:cytochrome b
MNAVAPPRPLRVWDLPTRLFHWLLAATVVGSFVSGQGRPHGLARALRRRGARDAAVPPGVGRGRRPLRAVGAFVRGPGAVLEYVRGVGATHAPGHNPLGALSVIGLLAVLAFQAVSGLFTSDDHRLRGGRSPATSRARPRRC